jgi:hypothetical protein
MTRMNSKTHLLIVLLGSGIAGSTFHSAHSQTLHAEKPQTQLLGKGTKHYDQLKAEKPVTGGGKSNATLAARFTPVAPYLRGGLSFSAAAKAHFQNMQPANVWFKIPAWLAGKWEFFEARTTSYTDLKTGKTNSHPEDSNTEATSVWGWQRDKNGDIWEYENSPHATESRTDQMLTYYVRHENEPISSSQTKLICKMTYTYSSINASTRMISKTYQSEDMVSYVQEEQDRLRRDVSSKIFDQDGNPIALSTSYSIAERILPFVPIKSANGNNISMLFRDYLKNHGLSDLIPDH